MEIELIRDAALFGAVLCLVLVLIGTVIDLLRGKIYVRRDPAPAPIKPALCKHCGRDYHDHEAKHHYCPAKSGWAEVTFQEGSDE